jgi:PPK2 family polyphosphate:nucleotide phosphotransferase
MQFKQFRVKPNQTVKLKDWPTRIEPVYRSKKQYGELLQQQIKAMRELQSKLYADNRQALLIIFQAMDAAGKDSAIKHVMSGVNPQGCQVFSFKHPSAEELDHDFLWRTTRCLPERGRIGIFNRSYYEEVLIVRVHPELLEAQGLTVDERDLEQLWLDRYESIVEMENHLSRNGTRIIKFYLNLSREEQRSRFLSRIEQSEKNWKFSLADLKERACWKQYMQAYASCISATSSKQAPWHIVPADDKENARLIIADIIVDTLQDMRLDYPKLNAAQLQELAQAGKLLQQERD